MSTMLRDNNFLGRKSAFILILALIFVFFTSCSNIGIFQNGGLVIAVPGSRSVSESTVFTVTVADAAGNKQNKTVVAGGSAQFENLLPGLYSIGVEGKESDISTMYGVAEVSVAAGKTATASIALSTVAHSLDALQQLIKKGGTVYIGSDIDIRGDSGLEVIKNKVHLVALKDVVLRNNVDAPGLTVQDSKVTLGGGEYTLTLDGNDKGQYGVSVTDGTLILEKNAIITNCSKSGVYLSKADFTMNGGIISENAATSGGGVYIEEGSFIMNDGSITANELFNSGTSYGGGIYIEKGDFTMNGGFITNNTKGINQGGGIWVAETGDFTMTNGTITGNTAGLGGGVYLYGLPDEGSDKATCTLNGGTITGNSSASGEGADIYAENTTFTNNGATVGDVAPRQ